MLGRERPAREPIQDPFQDSLANATLCGGPARLNGRWQDHPVQDMTGSSLKILLALDGSDYSDSVARAAAQLFSEAQQVFLLSVVEPPTGPGAEPGMEGEVIKAEHDRLDALHSSLAEAHFGGRDRVQSIVMDGKAAQTICSQARSLAADVVIMGSRGRGRLESAFLGSVSEDVIHGSEVPVMIVKSSKK